MMNMLDKHLTLHPTEGVKSMVFYLRDHGFDPGPKHMRRLFKLMGCQAISQRKNLTKGARREYIRPYLLRDLAITKANQVWCTDITYIPMAKGFLYVTAFIDVHSRKIMGWGISNGMTTKWCMEVLEEAICQNGKPAILNSDQGGQYTGKDWVEGLGKLKIQISMDGIGRATDNAWTERFWKTLKYDYVYLNPCDNGLELFEGVQGHIAYYHQKRHHTTGMKPEEAYRISRIKAAA